MELWDVYDERRNKKPYAHERGKPLADGDWHLVVEVWTATPEGKLLMTLRHPDKQFGNLWECTGGSALQGEDSLTAVRRELEEETGLRMGENQPTLLCTTLHHHSIVDTYVIRLPFTLSDIVLQEGETVDARLVDLDWLEDPANEAFLPEPVLERLQTARPLLRRFLSGGEQ